MMGLRDLVDPWIAREMAQPFWQMILGVIFASMTIGALTLYYLTKIWPLLIYGASLGFISVIYLAVSAPIAIPAL